MNTSRTAWLSGVSIILAFALAACDQSGPAEEVGKSMDETIEKAGNQMDIASKNPIEKGDRAGVAIDDTAITTKVKAAILMEPALEVLQIHVDTTAGVTTLTGSADSQRNSDRAEEIATAVAGVLAVENRLAIESAL